MPADIKILKVASAQLVFFINPLLATKSKLDLAQMIIKSTDNIFDGPPTILPIPDDAPQEIPRIILKNGANTLTCNVCINRIDFLFRESKAFNEGMCLPEFWSDYSKTINNFTNCIKKDLDTSITRLGFVVNLFCGLKGSANKYLTKEYLKSNIFSDPFEIQLNVLNKLVLDGFVNINRWLKFKPIRFITNISNDTALSVELDLNTSPEEKHDFKTEEVVKFFNLAYNHIISEAAKLIISD